MGGVLGNRRGFTLTEILVVVGIIVLLTAIVLPNLPGYLTITKKNRAETDINAMEVALGEYGADFGTFPGDVFPTEDINNNGKLDTGEDVGVDVDRDGTVDYATAANGRLDHGDGVVNIDDLDWALRTTARNGPYMTDGVPLDPWGRKYIYWAPLTRPTYNTNDGNDRGDENYLWIDPADDDTAADVGLGLPARTLCTEDIDANGKLDPGEDVGIADYDVEAGVLDVSAGFRNMRAGAGNGILDHGDDDNKNYDIETYIDMNPVVIPVHLELGNADISPDGLSRNRGYYIYCVGRDGIDDTATGYEDLNVNSIFNDGNGGRPLLDIDPATTFSEDINSTPNGNLDTGYEDTGNDGVPGTKDASEDDGEEAAASAEEFDGPYNDRDPDNTFDIGGDDINSWNKAAPWNDHTSYSG
jgi:prepilin-type N-terminal cleavage/methylation domain-containing protein